jgi:NAD(P)-dependent dehydrogenase (short-subunit alcohol dehydrogenase family)
MIEREDLAYWRTEWERHTPMKRMATVDDLVGPAVFLASDASAFCTGIDLIVNGGYVCW